MAGLAITGLDPWRKDAPPGLSLPAATAVGRWDLFVGIDTLTEALFLRGGPDHWELWSVLGATPQVLDAFLAHPDRREWIMGCGPAVAGVGDVPPAEAAAGLALALVQARYPLGVPVPPYEGGLLPAAELEAIVAGFTASLDANRERAEQAEAVSRFPILAMARNLGLDPRPDGRAQDTWSARCPNTASHGIWIAAASGIFGCGYCRRQGGPEELRAFHEHARARRPVPSKERT